MELQIFFILIASSSYSTYRCKSRCALRNSNGDTNNTESKETAPNRNMHPISYHWGAFVGHRVLYIHCKNTISCSSRVVWIEIMVLLIIRDSTCLLPKSPLKAYNAGSYNVPASYQSVCQKLTVCLLVTKLSVP